MSATQGAQMSQAKCAGALLDDGGWYLASASRPQELLMLTEQYPEFAGVELPRGTMEALD